MSYYKNANIEKRFDLDGCSQTCPKLDSIGKRMIGIDLYQPYDSLKYIVEIKILFIFYLIIQKYE